jgi:hypothetical protein
LFVHDLISFSCLFDGLFGWFVVLAITEVQPEIWAEVTPKMQKT